MRCKTCDDTGWVCGTHCNRPCTGLRACVCGGWGIPCIICNGDGEQPAPWNMFVEGSCTNNDNAETAKTADVERLMTPTNRKL
jgi:hypothetical protein